MSATILRCDARALPLAAESVDCCVTSPPYWGLRDYGQPDQIGLEPTPDAYVANMVAVFREVRRVLKPAGTLWLNLGDSYAASGMGGNPSGSPHVKQGTNRGSCEGVHVGRRKEAPPGLKPKDLVGIPWMVAFALRSDGWFLRSDIVWAKPNPMPESVRDRPTKAHEYVFLLSKGETYHYDADAIAEPSVSTHPSGNGFKRPERVTMGGRGNDEQWTPTATRNRRTVWTIPTKPFSGAHFAVMPEALAEPCVLAGCPESGIVLDPFAGSGTVGRVALRHRRRAVLCDLNPKYLAEIVTERVAKVQVEMPLRAAGAR